MPSIDQIIQDEIARNAKREIRNAVTEWLQHEASEAVVEQVKTAIQPFLVMMNDQRKVIEALRAQLEVASQPLSRTIPGMPRNNPKDTAIPFQPNQTPATSPELANPAAKEGIPCATAASRPVPSRRKTKGDKNDPALVASTPRPEGWCFRNEPRLSKERIVRVREKLGISQIQLGMLLGVDTFVIQNWEAGKTAPAIDQKRQIAFIRDLPLAKRRKLFISKKILRRGGQE